MEDVISRPAREALGDTKRQCTATSQQTGERCRRAPIPGGFVCAMHGGKIPNVQRAARERLLAMVDPALDALLRFLRTAPPCPHCGRSDADRDPTVLRAAQVVLDRTGFGPAATLQVTVDPREEALNAMTDDELVAHATALQEQLREKAANAAAIPVVAEVVDGGDSD